MSTNAPSELALARADELARAHGLGPDALTKMQRMALATILDCAAAAGGAGIYCSERGLGRARRRLFPGIRAERVGSATLKALAKAGLIRIDFGGQDAPTFVEVLPTREEKETASHERTVCGDDRGKLTEVSSGRYEGWRLLPNGKRDRKHFLADNDTKARELFWQWRGDEDVRELRERERMVGYERAGGRPAVPDVTEPPRRPASVSNGSMTGGNVMLKYYVLMIVGGPPLFFFESPDKAVAVQDALEQAAKASGFAAKYDVCEVKAWAE